MKKRRFLLTSIALGLSILSTPMISQASLPTHVDGQQVPSLAPMLEKVLPAVVSISVEGKAKNHGGAPFQGIPEEFRFFFGPRCFQ